MSADTLTVRGPYTDGSFCVVEQIGGKLIGRGSYRSKGLADARLFQMRDERGGVRR